MARAPDTKWLRGTAGLVVAGGLAVFASQIGLCAVSGGSDDGVTDGRSPERIVAPAPFHPPSLRERRGVQRPDASGPVSPTRPTVDGPDEGFDPDVGVPWRLLQLVHADAPPPLAWDAQTRDAFRETQMVSAYEGLIDACGLPHRLVDVACEEPPCLAVWASPPGSAKPTSCPGWVERWEDRTLFQVAFDVDCPGGRTVRAELVAPYVAVVESVPAEHHERAAQRLAQRATAYVADDWCAQ